MSGDFDDLDEDEIEQIEMSERIDKLASMPDPPRIDLAERVARGAALLDERRPGWAEEIAVDRLAMAECDRCIIGQLYGDFNRDWWKLISNGGAASHGFCLSTNDFCHPDWATLADLWRAEIALRLSPQEAPRA